VARHTESHRGTERRSVPNEEGNAMRGAATAARARAPAAARCRSTAFLRRAEPATAKPTRGDTHARIVCVDVWWHVFFIIIQSF
jgi:hypothetical protein